MKTARGFTLIEALVGMVVGTIVLAGAYSIWLTHQEESYRLSKKIELRNKLTLSSKRLQRSVTLAGLGLAGAANLGKYDAIGSDTLIVFTNPREESSVLSADIDHHQALLTVDAPALFAEGGYVAISGAGHAELRRISAVSGNTLHLDSAFVNDYPRAVCKAFPAERERYYTDRDSLHFIHENSEGAHVVATDVRNFQVSFSDRTGKPTETVARIRSVLFSLTGVYPAKAGALSTLIYSSTAIPRNTL